MTAARFIIKPDQDPLPEYMSNLALHTDIFYCHSGHIPPVLLADSSQVSVTDMRKLLHR